ncbi:helix-turn-helix domain-containing protein [Nonomuraea sp. 10N515B]|uniref:helix-turn-helix domain-containing protein n=1 Tax=Nonomuraea sp. 10N515B TaxID=3457422 RepID=UPI003FCEB6DF
MLQNESTTRGRRERPVPPGPLQEFAQGLRDLRAAAGNPSYRAMERKAGYSASALSAAAAGDRLPSLAVTQAYVGACGGDQDEWTRIWHTLRGDLDRPSDGGLGLTRAANAHHRRARPGGRAIRLSAIVATLGLIGLGTIGAFQTPPPVQRKPSPSPMSQNRAAEPPAPPAQPHQQTRPAFTAVAGPGCPRDTSRSVLVSGVPGRDGWKDASVPGWRGAGCGDGFLFSELTYDPRAAAHPQNSFQWRFTTGLRGRQQCFVAVYVPKSSFADQSVRYTVSDGFDRDARTVAEFTLDQRMRQGTWVPAPVPVVVATGLVMVKITDDGKGNTTGDQSMAAGPVRLACP